MRSNPALWKRLLAHPLDETRGSKPFSVKLAEDQGWTADDTARVMEEYRRFLYLVKTRKIAAVPPEPIDAAWAMHLTYTRNYWDQLVPEVLGEKLHRDSLASEDHERSSKAYESLISAYREEFGEAPPCDIWTDPKAWSWGSWVAVLIIGGVLGGFLSFGLMWLFSTIFGIRLGDSEVDTSLERAGVAMFLVCWAAGFFSPIWAWLLTRRAPRLKTSKRRQRSGSFSFGVGDFSIELGSGRTRD